MGNGQNEEYTNECSQWLYSRNSSAASAVIVLVHGLNQRPSSWNDLTDFLTGLGLHVFRIGLTGHRGLSFSDMFDARAEIWEDELLMGHRQARQHFPALPVYLIAYSLGALLAMAVQLKKGSCLFERQVLLAPALVIRPYTRLVLPLTSVFSYLPSRSPESYVANRQGTTSEAYRALFQIEKEVRSFHDYTALNVPTRILMRADDELISFKGTLKLLEERHLDQWKMIELSEGVERKCDLSYKHLFIDRSSAGKVMWEKMMNEISFFLA
jgi:pimeloyl-ACP methyl ester carboxylesterase